MGLGAQQGGPGPADLKNVVRAVMPVALALPSPSPSPDATRLNFFSNFNCCPFIHPFSAALLMVHGAYYYYEYLETSKDFNNILRIIRLNFFSDSTAVLSQYDTKI